MAAFLARRSERDFLALYRRHTPALHRCVLRLLAGRAEEAEEVVQETWVRALRGLSGFRGDSSLRTWLTGIALRCARERERRDARAQGLTDDLELAADDAEPSGSFDRVSPAGLEDAVSRLPADFRRVLVLHDVEGHTHDAIARMLDIAPGTSRSQLSRARRRLRTLLASSEPAVEPS